MKNIFSSMMVFFLLFASAVHSRLLHIPFTGGKYSGTFNVSGYSTSTSFPDTVIIDSVVTIISYTAHLQNTGCAFSNDEYGISIWNPNGVTGKKADSDTIWIGASVFPASLTQMDSVPSPNLVPNRILGNSPRGLKIGIQERDGVCAYPRFTTLNGYNRITYFQFNKSSGNRYGKLMVNTYEVHPLTTFPPDRILLGITMSFTISSTTDLNDGPVPVYEIKPGNGGGLKKSERMVDPLGRKSTLGPSRLFQQVPLLPR